MTRLASFSAAARVLGYTRWAVSQQIAALEAGLGARLLSRRPVEPTEAGAHRTELLHGGDPLTASLRIAEHRAWG